MQKEMASSRSHHTAVDLVRTPVVRRISCCLCFVWYARQWRTSVGGCPSFPPPLVVDPPVLLATPPNTHLSWVLAGKGN